MSTAQRGLDSFRSTLLRVPVLYEGLQAVRDWRLHAKGVSSGSFAQHGEDLKLLALLRELGADGPYVDIGCNHPFKLSNTYLLYRSGWRGVCVDPLPRFKPLYQRWRAEDQFFCTAIGEAAGQIELHQFEWDPLSTLDSALADQYIAGGFRRLRKLPVSVMTVDQILLKSGIAAPVSLLSIDIEGHELPALRSMDLERWQPAVICLEVLTADGSRNTTAEQYLLDRGYRIHGDLGFNVILVRNLPQRKD